VTLWVVNVRPPESRHPRHGVRYQTNRHWEGHGSPGRDQGQEEEDEEQANGAGLSGDEGVNDLGPTDDDGDPL
jgi:hypothetical protein